MFSEILTVEERALKGSYRRSSGKKNNERSRKARDRLQGVAEMSQIPINPMPIGALADATAGAIPNTLRDPSAVSAASFDRDGFVSVPALTTLEDIELIRSLLDPLFSDFNRLGDRAVDLAGPREPGTPLRSPEINEAVILEPRLRHTLAYARCREIARSLLGVPVGYQFDHAIFKAPQNQTPTAWHQDQAYSQEPIPLRSVHFWIPLQAVTESNGCMWFIPGSSRGGVLPHRVLNTRLNGENRPTGGSTLIADNVDTSKAVACPLAAGGATLHHPLTLHYTGANQTNRYRKAWIIHFGAYGWFRRRLHPKALAARVRASLGLNRCARHLLSRYSPGPSPTNLAQAAWIRCGVIGQDSAPSRGALKHVQQRAHSFNSTDGSRLTCMGGQILRLYFAWSHTLTYKTAREKR